MKIVWKDLLPVVGIMVIIVVGAGILTYMLQEHHNETYRLANEEIKQNTTASNDYRQGWTDAIERCRQLDARAENVTMIN